METKICNCCDEDLPLSAFKLNRGRRCKKCTGRINAILRKQRMREWLNSLKEGQLCADCVLPFPAFVLDFDHRDGEIKLFDICQAVHRKSWGKARILTEIAKCDLVCANCHRVRTHNRELRGGTHKTPAKLVDLRKQRKAYEANQKARRAAQDSSDDTQEGLPTLASS